MPNQEKIDENVLKKTLMYSIFDGSFWSAMVGFGESIFSLFAIFLNASTVQLGLIGSLPQTLGSMVQVFSRRILGLFPSRKAFIIFGITIQTLSLIPLPFVYFWFKENPVMYALALICLYWMGGMLASPAWTSWMGDLVPENIRGSYFGKRNAIAGIVSFSTMILAGIILSLFTQNPIYGFTILFLTAAGMRFFSGLFVSLKYEPNFENSGHNSISFKEFLTEADMQNYGYYILLGSLMNFSVFISAPFFVAYMKQDLGLSYFLITIINAIAIVVKCIFTPIWGKLCDRYGSRKVFAVSAFMIPFVPVIWIFSRSLFWIVIFQIISGFAWAAYEISSSNFIFEMVPKNKRVTSSAYLNLLIGIGILLGGLIGGHIVSHNNIFWSKYYLVFIISGMARLIVSIIFVPKIKETRVVEKISYKRLLTSVFDAGIHTSGLSKFVIPRHKQPHVKNKKKHKSKKKF